MKRQWLLAVLLGVVAAGTLSFVALASERTYHSTIASDESLQAHGVVLRGPAILSAAPSVDETSARDVAESVAGLVDHRSVEAFRIDTPAAPGSHSGTCWLVLFKGGDGPPSFGPADAGKATFTSMYTGVLVDDVTGAVIYTFAGGSLQR